MCDFDSTVIRCEPSPLYLPVDHKHQASSCFPILNHHLSSFSASTSLASIKLIPIRIYMTKQLSLKFDTNSLLRAGLYKLSSNNASSKYKKFTEHI